MFYEWLYVVLLISVTNVHNTSFRRIKDGKAVDVDMRYMVYLAKAEKSETKYDAWICGGSIVSPDFIVSSAACVQDVKYMYAIAGYDRYVNVKEMDADQCIKNSKKKVVLTCTPKTYDFEYHKIEKWANVDIALLKVESPYDFSASAPVPGCSYVPDKIQINYEPKYQVPGTDAMILGWGHREKWRQTSDKTDYNEKTLQYSPILIMDKTECKRQYSEDNKDLLPLIDKYMICAQNEGNIDDRGELIERSQLVDGCEPGALRIGGICQQVHQGSYNKKPMLRPLLRFRTSDENLGPPDPAPIASPPEPAPITSASEPAPTPSSPNPAIPSSQSQTSNQKNVNDDTVTFEDIMSSLRRAMNGTTFNHTRRSGICQNDHGGPLVTWVGKHERLIGVASVFRLDGQFTCIGPYLFTSTQCNGAFLDCVISNGVDRMKLNNAGANDPNICDLPPKERGFDIIERRISWSHHPDGPAANELTEDLFERPVIPLRLLG
ncbi:trypsin domain-containing protein [Phthorimaea operculella]|nr:trypsin domain-containing protein [Phthorimaea operculella]